MAIWHTNFHEFYQYLNIFFTISYVCASGKSSENSSLSLVVLQGMVIMVFFCMDVDADMSYLVLFAVSMI